jgi:hypothetical protein
VRKFAWVTVALFLSVLTGCSDDVSSARPPTVPASSPSTSSTADPSPTPDEQTPEEFVRAWVAEYNAMQNTGETEKFRSLSLRCKACASVADQMDAIYGAGGYVKTKGWSLTSLRVSKPNGKGQRVVTVEVDSAPIEYVEEAGGPTQSFPGGDSRYELSIAPRTATWNMFNIAQVAT